MSLERFIDDPWRAEHRAYDESAFNIRPAPEFATAEVLVASLYRSLGFTEYPQSEVPKAGREFDRVSQQNRSPGKVQANIGADTWRVVLHGVLESPKHPNQNALRFLQLSPIVPDIALYSGTSRQKGNAWNPGSLIQRMVQLGSNSTAEANDLWNRMFDAMSVGEGDDIWARWLQEEFESRKTVGGPCWKRGALKQNPNLPDHEKPGLHFPSRQFVTDIEAIITAKSCMTRRQWVSLLEAVVRLGSVTHVLWLCDVNDKLWKQVKKILEGAEPCTAKQLKEQIVSRTGPYLAYGKPALPIVRDYASRFLISRLGINLLLWRLEALGSPIQSLSSCSDLHKFMSAVLAQRSQLQKVDFLSQLSLLQDNQAQTIACKNGIGAHLVEFARYALGQRQTTNESLRGYDQGYILQKRAKHASAPWVVSFGPVAVLALVHCCLREAAGPRSVQRLCQHLEKYGIAIDRADITNSDLGRKLRMLGLVLDSPDAESGMLLVPPFEAASTVSL